MIEILLAIGTIQCLFLVLIVSSKKPRDFSDQILIGILIFWALRFASYWAVLNDFHQEYPRLLGIEQTLFLVDGPILYLYVLALIKEIPPFRINYLWHGLPFLTVLVHTSVKFSYYTNQEILKLFGNHSYLLFAQETSQLHWDEQLFIFGVCVSLLYYTWMIYQALKRFRSKIANPPSESETRMWSWLKTSLLCWLGFFVIPLIIFLINYITNWWPIYLTNAPLIYAFLVLIFLPAYQALKFSSEPNPQKEEEAAESIKNEDTALARYQKSGLKEEQALAYQNKLEKFMEAEKPFLNADLNLSSLAESLKISPNHLSQIINERFGKTFYDFINSYRVEEVKKKLADPNFQAYTILGIAEECGFKSKSSFNTAFKRFAGMPPSVYKKQHSNPKSN